MRLSTKIALAFLLLIAFAVGRGTSEPTAQAQVPDGAKTLTYTAGQGTLNDTATGYALNSTNFTGFPKYARQVTIEPLVANTSGQIEIRSAAATAGYELTIGQQHTYPLQGATIYVKVATAGDGICWQAWSDR